MGFHKLDWDEQFEESFHLIALYSSQEAYKIAYLLNKHLHLKFERERLDIDFSNQGNLVTFPLYLYKNNPQEINYFLIANKCTTTKTQTTSSGNLFSNNEFQKEEIHYFMPEFKKVDYFIKIEQNIEEKELANFIKTIKKIPEITSCTLVNPQQIKLYTNLIFH